MAHGQLLGKLGQSHLYSGQSHLYSGQQFVSLLQSSPQNFGYQNWHIFISLVYFDYFDIPPPGSGVVLPGDQLFT